MKEHAMGRDPSRPGCLDFLALLLTVALGFLLLIWSPWAPDEWNVVEINRLRGDYLLRNERWSREYAYPRDRGQIPPEIHEEAFSTGERKEELRRRRLERSSQGAGR